MKNLSSMVGLDILLEKISAFAESEPGKNIIRNLKPTISQEERTRSFENLSEIAQICSLLPNLSILQKKT